MKFRVKLLILTTCAVFTTAQRYNHQRRQILPVAPQFPTGNINAGVSGGGQANFDVNIIGPRQRNEQTIEEAWNNFKVTKKNKKNLKK